MQLNLAGRLRLASFFVAALSLPAAQIEPAQADSVAYQLNGAHDGDCSASDLKPPLVVKWKVNLGPAYISYPIVAEGKVFVVIDDEAANTGRLFALSADSGALDWGPLEIPMRYHQCFAALCYDAGKIFVVSSSGILQAFDAGSGSPIWTVAFPRETASLVVNDFGAPPTASGGIVYASGYAGEQNPLGKEARLFAVDESDGTILWTKSGRGPGVDAPTVGGKTVFDESEFGLAYLSAFDSATGAFRWRYGGFTADQLGAAPLAYLPLDNTPAYYKGKLYFRRDSTSLVLCASNGSPEPLAVPQAAIAAFDKERGFFLSSTGVLTGVDLLTGADAWSAAGSGATFVTAPIVVNHIVYECAADGTLSLLDEESGNTIDQVSLGDTVNGPNVNPIGPTVDGEVPLPGIAASRDLVVVSTQSYVVALTGASSK